ncbi:MAG: pyridoxamine 5'-phosphate oxidase family protein [Firmicutes bacterium]|nr:pyridoxamine 5'-phosphate oxidase family protein [Bacillota bacterium]
MRRHDKEITDHRQIMDVLSRCTVINFAMHDGDYPYVQTMNFGFADTEYGLKLFFHGANEGKTPTLLAQNNKVGFIIYKNYGEVIGQTVCTSDTVFESVCGYGEVQVLSDPAELDAALRAIIRQAGDQRPDDFHAERYKKMAVYRLDVRDYTCKVARKDAIGIPFTQVNAE